MKKRWKVITCLCAGCASLALLAGCGSSSVTTANDSAAGGYASNATMDTADVYTKSYDYDAYEAEEAYYDDAEAVEAGQVSETAQSANRKLIRTVYLDVETEELDDLLAHVDKKVREYGGYTENANTRNNSYASGRVDGRSAALTLRIPAKNLDAFLDAVAEQSNVTYRSESVEDVTLSYVDLESHKEALLEEQSRLLDLMEDAETIEDLIAIEDRLTTVRYELESMESQLRTYDNQVDYSTVTLSISEVKRYTPVEEEDTATRIRNGFLERTEDVIDGLREFGIGFVIHIPDIIMVVIVVVVIVLIVRLIVHFSRKGKERRARKREERRRKREQKAMQGAPYTPAQTANPPQPQPPVTPPGPTMQGNDPRQ